LPAGAFELSDRFIKPIAILSYLYGSVGHRGIRLPGFRRSEVLGPARGSLPSCSVTGRGTGVRQVVKSASSSQWDSNKAAQAGRGRHRAPARVSKSIKIITAAAVVAGVAGVFVGYKAEAGPHSDPVAKTVATYHGQRLNSHGTLAALGSAQPVLPRHAAAGKNSKNSQSGKTSSSRRPATTRHSVKAAQAHRSGGTAKTPAPSVIPEDGGNSASPSPSPSSGGGSANLKSAVQKDIASGNYMLAIGQYLAEHGYSKAAAAGVVGCVAGESAGNPESVGSGGGGLIGWTPISSAAPNPNIITGNPAQDMMTQLSDLLYYNSTEIGQSLVNQLNAISDPVSAADFFSANFEKPAVTYSDVRPSEAQQMFSELGG
jgi:Phage tail lysozyme